MTDDAPVSGNDQDQRPRWQVQPTPVGSPDQPLITEVPDPPNGPPTTPGKRAYRPEGSAAPPTTQAPPSHQAPPNGVPPMRQQGNPYGPPPGTSPYAPPGQYQTRPQSGPPQSGPPQSGPPQSGPPQGRPAQAPPQTGPQHAAPSQPAPPRAAQQSGSYSGPPATGQYAATSPGHQPANPPQQEPDHVPTAQDFLRARHQSIDIGPATWGWRGVLRKISFGLVKPKMGKKERAHREARAAVQRSFSGPRTVVFANPKGGAAKTTSVLAAGYTFGTVRGGGVVAWDNNETRGTLGMRGEQARHHNTTRELLDDLERFQDVYESRIGDLGAFVRSQGDAHFDVLASDERADVTGTIKASDFGAVHRLLERFYHLILVDTGNNLRAENWLAAAQTADLVVVTCTVREDTGYSGLWMLDALADAGHTEIKQKTITVLADPSPNVDAQLAKDLTDVYTQRTRAVFRIPYDPALVAGSVVQYDRLSEDTKAAWLKACAAMAESL
ncbi:MinD/ParA family ATP-binding protein [Nocardioides jensenii]|uniref:MinD/ParA family ATP-binding protein n=1 Tax=Nocardioides jensenii TaxID=1843 RepID=UPI00157BA611|nr:hypothetical protein [Nocardioides jensenii]